jgi:heme exporter protein C
MIYSGCLLVRGSLSDAHRRARISAVLAVLGLFDLPLVIMATRWFRGIHPISPAMEPAMRYILFFSVISFSVFFAVLLVSRARQIQLETMLSELTRHLPSRNLTATATATAIGN